MKRIQRKRTKGWKMPANTVYVGRPTKWGNPISVKDHGRERAIYLYRELITGRMLAGMLDLEELRGNDLACWCKLDETCHADVLIEMLAERIDTPSNEGNEETPTESTPCVVVEEKKDVERPLCKCARPCKKRIKPKAATSATRRGGNPWIKR